jgi:predicted nucleotidyltransferase
MTLDVMPTDGSVFGFTNRWYEDGIANARSVDVAEGISIRVLSAPHFIATKLEAFKGRGKRDFLGSADIEDIVRIVDGREEIVDEIGTCEANLREYLRHETGVLVADEDFLDALPGHLMGDVASQARAELVRRRLRKMSGET